MILAKLPVQNLLHAITQIDSMHMHGQVCMGSIAIGPPTFLPLAMPLIRPVKPCKVKNSLHEDPHLPYSK